MSNDARDPHAVSSEEAQQYYAGLPSQPLLLYRTGKVRWSRPSGLYPPRRLKELREVFSHPIANVWNDDLAWKVVEVLDVHKIRFTTIDVVRFKRVDEAPEDEREEEDQTVGPVTIWIGVAPASTSPTAAHNAAQDVLALLKDYEIADVDVEYRESLYRREAGPQFFKSVDSRHPLVEVISPLTPALGLSISSKAAPEVQGMMALYLSEGGPNNRLLGFTCRHVVVGVEEKTDYIYHPTAPHRDVILLGQRSFTNLNDSIKNRIKSHDYTAKHWRKNIERFAEREKGVDTVDVEEAKGARIETQWLLDKAENTIKALEGLLDRVNKDWKPLNNRVFGHVLRSPAIGFSVGEHRFTEDWAIIQIDRAKLGDGFQGNKIDLGTKLSPGAFKRKCFPRGGCNWSFKYPHDRLLPLVGTITDKEMRTPNMWGPDGEPCLLVVKSGNATGTTIGRASGVFSVVREYPTETVRHTSMEWAIVGYGKSEVFSRPGDSGSIIADIHGRIGGMLTSGSGTTDSSDITYATPFWWLLQRIRSNGYPNAHLNVLD